MDYNYSITFGSCGNLDLHWTIQGLLSDLAYEGNWVLRIIFYEKGYIL